MLKRFFCILFVCFLFFAVSLPALATENAISVRIYSPEDLAALAENCRLDIYSQDLTVYLMQDIDLSGVTFECIPIFSGKFCGNKHTISGLNIHSDGSAQGFFRYLTKSAIVKDLTLRAEITPGGSRSIIGGIAGENSGLIQNCTFIGSVSGNDNVGSMAGINTVTGIIEDCRTEGTLTGDHFVGGIVGTNYGVIRRCENYTLINATPQENSVALSDITLDNITTTETTNTVTDIGGIAGLSTGVIRNCINYGNVGYKHIGYNIGGIAGTQSGHIADCSNYGAIEGRKEVGGIVGQMEPTTYIEYSTDLFQILKGQLNEMSELVSDVSSNVQGNASGVGVHIGTLQGQTTTAWEAIDALIPKEEGEMPDQDAIMAAFSTVSSTMSKMPQTINNIGYALQSTISGLTRDLRLVSDQINKMGETIDSAAETVGGTLTDISDLDTPESFSGKVQGCFNYGSVQGDMNIGGIAGAISIENDLDFLEDWSQQGETSLNFDSKLRAVVTQCENHGAVTGKTQNIGGITGWQTLGLVKGCINTGDISASTADYVGGISGRSNGFIRLCGAKCTIQGNTAIGGIAGSATIVTDCRSMVIFASGTEKIGSILGTADKNESEDEDPIRENYSFEPMGSIGAIDGISYFSCAESLDVETFLKLPNLHDMFRKVHITFQFQDGTEKVLSVTPGSKLNERRIPSLPVIDGINGYWEGLADTDLSYIAYDITFAAVYPPNVNVIACGTVENTNLPLLLLDGSFHSGVNSEIRISSHVPTIGTRDRFIGCWDIEVPFSSEEISARLHAGDGEETFLVMRLNEDGSWESLPCSTDGSYVVFNVREGTQCIALVHAEPSPYLTVCLITAAVLAVLLCVALILTRKRK